MNHMNYLSKCAILISIFALSVFTIQAADYEIKKAGVAPVIDGELDAIWDLVDWIPLDYAIDGEMPTADDASVKFKVLWDKASLYFYADITDENIAIWEGEGWPKDCYSWDNIEFYLSVNHTKADSYVNGDAQYRINVGWADTMTIMNSPAGSVSFSQFDTEFIQKEKDDFTGWITEVRFPWALIAHALAEVPAIADDTEVLMEVHYGDNDGEVDGSGNPLREVKLSWMNSSGADDNWQNTQHWGIVLLSGEVVGQVGINNIRSKNLVRVLSNPVSDVLRITSGNEIQQVKVYSITGKEVLFLNSIDAQRNIEINVSNLHQGIYLVETIDVNNNETVQKVIKR